MFEFVLSGSGGELSPPSGGFCLVNFFVRRDRRGASANRGRRNGLGLTGTSRLRCRDSGHNRSSGCSRHGRCSWRSRSSRGGHSRRNSRCRRDGDGRSSRNGRCHRCHRRTRDSRDTPVCRRKRLIRNVLCRVGDGLPLRRDQSASHRGTRRQHPRMNGLGTRAPGRNGRIAGYLTRLHGINRDLRAGRRKERLLLAALLRTASLRRNRIPRRLRKVI